MLRRLLRNRLDAEEKKLGESMDYLRHIVDVSPSAFMRFASLLPFSNSRKVLPPDVWYIAQLVALQREDCGPCLQIAVNLALKDRVDADVIRAVLDGRTEHLSETQAEVLQFAKAATDPAGDANALRDTMRQHFGERGLIELAYAIASSRIPPTVKRVLGYAQSCLHVSIRAGQDGPVNPESELTR